MIFEKIPGKLNNRTIVNVMDRMRRMEKVVKLRFRKNDVSNAEAFERHAEEKPEFRTSLIERQDVLSDMSLGRSSLNYSGCEVIAVYNLLSRYDEGSFKVGLPELIETFEKDGIIHAGRFGVSPRSMAEYLRGLGLNVNFTTDETDFDVLGFYCDHFILTVMNDRRNIFKQVHTFYISKEGDCLISHNAGLRMRYFSISEIIKALPDGRAKGICLIGIKEDQD
ncbi:MAG: hypothetical protein IKS99_00860 [Firmicutes bacterium]|nr:hypothetical protein [Bacillota bacterium]